MLLVDLNNAFAQSREVLEIGTLVIQTPLPKNLDYRVVEERPPREPVRPQPLERREMPAREEIREIRREEACILASETHSLCHSSRILSGDGNLLIR